MGSHRHHGASSPPDQEDDIHPVNTPPHPSINPFLVGLDSESLDNLSPEMLEAALLAMREDPENTQHYTAKCMLLVQKSEQYAIVAKVIADSDTSLEAKLLMAFSMGCVAGGPCTLMAVDEGFIDGGDDEDDEYEGAD
jgi:hypothetical protein